MLLAVYFQYILNIALADCCVGRVASLWQLVPRPVTLRLMFDRWLDNHQKMAIETCEPWALY
ncbi:hypothetical protein AF72_05160 [Xylella taiwanensis]|uniref:Uncharacterized protein n=1 Tax=Xylella taiwanensis TaxID=1444770 RepID=Z9JL23_9GAMM|nr:hypothetical protein AB672_02490 [Xylella taiwanensis]EWS78467.1 hypothetical protein AF72_05160 [Xylella taiwanensis]